jgi:enoyl-CoA hydratase/carnithine racemase
MNVQNEELGELPSLSFSEGVATITLNRPRVLNRMQAEDVIQLREYWAQIQSDKSVHVLVLTGMGRVFCAGYDLNELSERSGAIPAGVRSQRPLPDFSAMTVELENLRVPTVCRLNGGVYGGGTDLALSCDFRVGSTETEMFMPASRLGLHYYTEGLIRWSARLGTNASKKLFLTGVTIKAEEMKQIGYLTDLIEPAALDETVSALVDRLSQQAPLALEGMKRALNEIARGTLDASASDQRHVTSLGSEDLREGMAAWQEKRRPHFIGR